MDANAGYPAAHRTLGPVPKLGRPPASASGAMRATECRPHHGRPRRRAARWTDIEAPRAGSATGMGRVSLLAMLGALGLALVVVNDADALERLRHRLTPRAEQQVRAAPGRASARKSRRGQA